MIGAEFTARHFEEARHQVAGQLQLLRQPTCDLRRRTPLVAFDLADHDLRAIDLARQLALREPQGCPPHTYPLAEAS